MRRIFGSAQLGGHSGFENPRRSPPSRPILGSPKAAWVMQTGRRCRVRSAHAVRSRGGDVAALREGIGQGNAGRQCRIGFRDFQRTGIQAFSIRCVGIVQHDRFKNTEVIFLEGGGHRVRPFQS